MAALKATESSYKSFESELKVKKIFLLTLIPSPKANEKTYRETSGP